MRFSPVSTVLPLALILGLVAACGDDEETDGGDGSGGGTDELSFTGTYLSAPEREAEVVDPQLGSISASAPDFVPAAGSPVAGAGMTPPVGGFFTGVDYIGAFEPGGADWTDGWTVWATGPVETGDRTEVVVSEGITENITWTADNVYRLTAPIYVSNGATLTIEPGTLVVGDNGSALIITRAAMLMAEGTAEAPITFTSSKAVAERVPGDWGGVVLLGEAPINVGTNNIEGLAADAASSYGGQDAAHNCGTLRYVRIEYAGFVFGTDNELNSLTLGGCGSETTLEYIHTYRGQDDGIEFFGGTANLRYAVVTQTGDDSLDWDEGYTGNVQFFVANQDADNGDRGFEGDNLEDNPTATPVSSPTIYNVTLVGGGTPNTEQEGMRLRHGTAGSIHNAIIINFGNAALKIDGADSEANATSGALDLSHFVMWQNGADGNSPF